MNHGCCSGTVGPVLGSEQPKAAAGHKSLCVIVVNQSCLGFETVLATGNGYKGKFMQISSDMELTERHRGGLNDETFLKL